MTFKELESLRRGDIVRRKDGFMAGVITFSDAVAADAPYADYFIVTSQAMLDKFNCNKWEIVRRRLEIQEELDEMEEPGK